MCDSAKRERVRKNFTLPPDIAATIEQHDNQSAFVEQAVRHETEAYHRRSVALEVIAEMTQLAKDYHDGDLPREFRLMQSELFDSFDVFQQDAEVTMSREPLEDVEGVNHDVDD